MNRIIYVCSLMFMCAFIAGCVTVTNDALPLDELPEIVVATEVDLVASPSHPASYLTGGNIAANATGKLLGKDENGAWLFVLHNEMLGWIPAFFARDNVSNLTPILDFELLSGECHTYLTETSDLSTGISSSINGAGLIIGAVMRPQVDGAFTGTSLAVELENGAVEDSQYLHLPLTPSTAVVLFSYTVNGLTKDSQIQFDLQTNSPEPLAFQAALFGDECAKPNNQLAIGSMNFVQHAQLSATASTPEQPESQPLDGESLKPTPAPSPVGTSETADELELTADSSTPAPIEIQSGPEEVFVLDLDKFEVGDLAKEYGTELMINEVSNQKYLTGLSENGRIELRNLDLQGSFEVVFTVDWSEFDSIFLLQADSGEDIRVTFDGSYITFGNTNKSWGSAAWKGGSDVNHCRILVSDDTAKFYINDAFFGTTIINAQVTYSRLFLTNVGKDERVEQLSVIDLNDEVNTTEVEAVKSTETGFVVDLESYEIGDLARELGTDLIIQQLDNQKYIAGLTENGRIELQDLDLQDNFEIVFTADWSEFDSVFLLQADRGKDIQVTFDGNDIAFGNTNKNWGNAAWKGGTDLNHCRILVSGDTAKLYINDVFFGTTVIEPDVIYSRLSISSIGQDERIHHLTGENF